MVDADLPGAPGPRSPVSAEPPPLARLLAVLAIVVAGVCGGLIGYAVTDLSCADGCTAASAGVGVASAVGAAVGVAVVSVLALRAMGEWNATPPEVRQARQRRR